MNDERIDELIALAALGELSDEEQRELDAVAARDPEVARELADALATAARVQQVGAERAPEGLRSRVLATVATTPQDEQVRRTTEVEAGRDVVALAPKRRPRLLPLLAAAAAVFALVAGAVVLVSTSGDDSDVIAEVVESPDAERRALDGALTGELAVVFSAAEDALVVEGSSLPLPDGTATYQLWLVSGDAATSVGVFRPDDDGDVQVRFDGVDPTGFVLGVTEEPAGGSDRPTLPILASA